MADAGFVILTVVFFTVCALLVRGFDLIVRSDDGESVGDTTTSSQ